MTDHERILIDLSLKILRDALDRTSAERIDTDPVRLALRCLLPYVKLNWPLTMYWEGAAAENPIGRFQSCNAALNGIVRQLEDAGSIPKSS